MKSQKQDKNSDVLKERVRKIVLVIAIIVFAISAYKLYSIFSQYQEAVEEYDGLKDTVIIDETPDEAGDTDANKDNTYRQKKVDFNKLKEINKDIKGWIEFETLPISYPVLQGSDNEYYLHHTYNGTQNTSASIFLDYQNKELFDATNTFIYGHNMKNGSMFGKLKNYETEEFYKKNQYFWIYTSTANYRYQIFSCYIVRADGNSYQMSYANKEEYKNYLTMIQEYSSYDTGVKVTTDDSIVTLSTCTSNPDNRFLVHAVKIETYKAK